MAFELCFLIIPRVISKSNAALSFNLFVPRWPFQVCPRHLPQFLLSTFSLFPFFLELLLLPGAGRGWGEAGFGPNSCRSGLASCIPRPPASSEGFPSLVSSSCQQGPRVSNAFGSHLITVLKMSSFSKLTSCLPRTMSREC